MRLALIMVSPAAGCARSIIYETGPVKHGAATRVDLAPKGPYHGATNGRRGTVMASYKLATYQSAQGPRAGMVVGESIFDVAEATGRSSYVTVLDVLEDWDSADKLLASAAAKASGGRKLAETTLRAPLPRPPD